MKLELEVWDCPSRKLQTKRLSSEGCAALKIKCLLNYQVFPTADDHQRCFMTCPSRATLVRGVAASTLDPTSARQDVPYKYPTRQVSRHVPKYEGGTARTTIDS